MDLEKPTTLAWRKFQLTEHGINGMLWLREQEPSVKPSTEAHTMIFDAGRVQGYKDCLDKILQLLAANPTPDKSLETASELEETR